MDTSSENVEMIDFATLPNYRGNGFSIFLLNKKEEVMDDRGIKTAYTIARAVSFPMYNSKISFKHKTPQLYQ